MSKVVVNGIELHEVSGATMHYEDVCEIANVSPDTKPTVLWYKKAAKTSGSLTPGDNGVNIDDDKFIAFNVTRPGHA